MADKYFYGLGRRKSATARVRLYKGKGKVTINDQTAELYFADDKKLIGLLTEPLALVNKQGDYDVSVRVDGGGRTGQVGAVRAGIAKALLVAHPDLRSVLKHAELLKRDPREKERKKYGLRSARKKEQFSKR